MTLKQLRQLAAQNGHTGREPKDLTPRLPDDFPNESKRNPQNSAPQYPKTADKRLARRIVRMLESTTVVQEIDRFLRNHPGQKSRISTKALLLGMVLAVYEASNWPTLPKPSHRTILPERSANTNNNVPKMTACHSWSINGPSGTSR